MSHAHPEAPTERRGRLTPARVLAAAVVIGSFSLWVVALGRIGVSDPPDTLEDRAFAEAAEPRCAAALADVERLPPASAARTATERAVTIDEATDRLEALVGELRAVAAGSGEDGRVVAAWLDDWTTYLGDRRGYAARLRDDETAELQLSTRRGQDITRPMDNLANVNGMPSCATPGDVG